MGDWPGQYPGEEGHEKGYRSGETQGLRGLTAVGELSCRTKPPVLRVPPLASLRILGGRYLKDFFTALGGGCSKVNKFIREVA